MSTQAVGQTAEMSPVGEVRELEQQYHLLDAQEKGHIGDVEYEGGGGKVNFRVGLEYSGGTFVESSGQKLTPSQKNRLDFLAEKYMPEGCWDFSINLSTLKDGNGNVLQPVRDRQGNVLYSEFERDMKELRELADIAIGVKMSWKTYVGRTIVGHTETFAPKHSLRLQQEFDFNDQALQKWLEEISKERPAPESDPNQSPEDARNAVDTLEKRAERTHRLCGRYYATSPMLDFGISLFDDRIKTLEKQVRSEDALPSDYGRLEKLRAMKKKLPDGTCDQNNFLRKDEQGNTTEGAPKLLERAAILTAGAYMPLPGDEVDVHKIHEKVHEYVDSFEKPLGDCSGMLDRFRGSSRTLLEDRAQIETEFEKAIVLAGFGDRASYEPRRVSLGAEERSDGYAVFMVQLADAIASKEAVNISSVVDGAAFNVAFMGLAKEDQMDFREAYRDAALSMQKAHAATEAPKTEGELSDIGAYMRAYGQSLSDARPSVA